MEYLLIVAAVAMTRWGLKPHHKLRWIAYANLALFAIFSLAFSRMTGGAASGVDALKFFVRGPILGSAQLDSFSQAKFMFFISAQVQAILPLSYAAFNMFAAMFMSYLGVLLVLWRIRKPTLEIIILLWVFTLLPGFHYWHASFSKEAVQLLFLAIFFVFTNLYIRGGALFVLLLVRPHIAVALVMAEMIARLFEKRLTFDRFATIGIGGLVGFSALAYLLVRLSGDDGGFSLERLWAAFSDYGGNWRTGELRLNDTGSPMAIIEFLLRPYPWESSSFVVFFSFFDSLVLTVFGGYLIWITAEKNMLKTPWLFAIIVMVLLAFTNPNAGTAHRKKQVLPFAALMIPVAAHMRRREREAARAVPA